MSDTTFPSPPAMQQPVPPPSRDLLTFTMLEALRSTRPWVRFLSILGFISSGFLILIGIGFAVFGAYQLMSGSSEGAFIAPLGLLYFLMALLYIFPSRYLYRYADAIRDALAAPSKTAAVERALQSQKSFWKFAGIMALLMLLLYIPGVVAAIAIPNLLTAMQRSKEKRTMADIRTIATAVEAYGVDHNRYPQAATMDDLAGLLEPVHVRTLPRVDGWGHPFAYEAASCYQGSCQEYYVASSGRDGKFERAAPSDWSGSPGVKTSWNEDIVYSNGSFVRAPEGYGGRHDY
jgi:type II secretory pathway pseudopilin PulG